MIKPLYEDLAKQYDGKVAFGKVDVDENQDAALEHGISAVPTFFFYEGQEALDTFSGADTTKLEALVKKLADR